MRYYKLDLSPYYNKKLVFSRGKITDDLGNDGVGINKRTFFDLNKTVELSGVDYIFKQKNSMDCIVCDNQNVVFRPTFSNKLHILGFMYWGANHDFFKLKYENGETRNAKVLLNDWSAAHNDLEDPHYIGYTQEKGYITVKTFYSCGKLKLPLYLHHCECESPINKKLKAITFPDNMYMHIMAITLECVNE